MSGKNELRRWAWYLGNSSVNLHSVILLKLKYFGLEHLKVFLLVLISSFLLGIEGLAQTPPSGSSGGGERTEKDLKFAPVPYINYDRTLGLSVGALPMIMYNMSKNDTISPSSLTGLLGMYTTNESWFGMIFNKTYFNEDKYRTVLATGTGFVNFQFFMSEPIDVGYLDYNVDMDFVFIELQRKLVGHLYFGLNYKYANMLTIVPEFELPGGGEIPEQEEEVVLHGLGAILLYDGRDDVYYPYNGMLFNLKFSTFPEFMGNELESEKIELDYNHFFPMRNNNDVLAARFYGGAGIGELSFNQQLIVGEGDIRGYTQGKFRGEQKLAIQAEYRWNPHEKIGIIGYTGAAMVFNGINSEDDGKFLPAIGTGFRYNVFPDNHMNVGIDIAAGLDDWGIYFRIGEAF